MKKNAIKTLRVLPIVLLSMLLTGNFAAAQTYCTPSNTYAYASYYYVDTVSTTGGLSNISNLGSGFSTNGYGDFTAMTVSAIQGDSIKIRISGQGSYYTYYYGLWIDWNNDGDFDDPGETIYDPANQTTYLEGITVTVHVPLTATAGNTRMRVGAAYIYYAGLYPLPSCGTNVNDYAEWEDYTFDVMPMAPPNNAGVVSIVSPDPFGAFCSGTQEVKVRVSNLGNNPLNSVHVNWSADGVAQTGQSLTFSPAIDSIAASKHDTVISLGYVNFPYQTAVNIKAWTSLPNGVTDTDSSDDTLNTDVTSNMLGVITHITPQDTAICAGSSVILDAGVQPAGVIFIWNNGAVTQQTSISQAGTYNVVVQSAEGCFAYDTVTVTVNPQPVAGTFGVVDIGGGNFQFTPTGMQNVSNYHWDFGDGSTLDDAYPNMQGHHYTQSGTYAVSLTVSNTCGAITLNKQVFVQPTTGIKDAGVVADALKVYPNPANNQVNIKAVATNVQLQQLSIYNMIGKKVYAETLQGENAVISVASLPAGVYQLIIQTNKGTATSKLEIMR